MSSKSKIIVGGFVPFTTIDYPGHLSAVVFTQGCPFNCHYCSNQELLKFRKYKDEDKTNWDYVLSVLEKRKKMLEAVVFSGGEPTSQDDELVSAIKDIKAISPNYKIGLHTNGTNSEQLKKVLPLIDWFGLDIKAVRSKYDDMVRAKSGNNPYDSLDLILQTGNEFEVRTTCYPKHLSKEDVLTIAKELADKGVKNYALQKYRPISEDASEPNALEINQFFNDQKFKEELKNLFPNGYMEFRE